MSVYPEYPAPPGNKHCSIAEIAGPALYTPVTPAAPVTVGGQVIQASAFGLKYIECVDGNFLSDDGQYGVRAILNATAPGQPVTSIRLMWYTAATGAEVGAVDLSSRTVRMAIKGVY